MESASLAQPLLFISDVHLGGFSKEKNALIESELIQLINYCQRNSIRIAILGDLFDYWMEYPNHIPDLGKKVLRRFASFNETMGPTLFITGNHDNWTRDHFSKIGFTLEHEHQILSLSGETVMALHGDGLADQTLGFPRPRMHQLIRSKQFISFYQKLLPPPLGITIMKYFSKLTRFMDWDSDKTQTLNSWAKQTLSNNHCDVIICGHDHIPRQKQFDFGTFINLGTFYKHKTMALYNNGSISLVTWKPQLQTLQPFD